MPDLSPAQITKLIQQYAPAECEPKKLTWLGDGAEGAVFCDCARIYKLIYQNPQPLNLYWQLCAFAERLGELNTDCVLTPRTVILGAGKYILLVFDLAESDDFLRPPKIPRERYITLLKEFRRIGWVCADLKPANLRVRKNGALTLVDIGQSLFPYSADLFASMCRRGFVMYALREKLPTAEAFKPYLRAVNQGADFTALEEVLDCGESLTQQYAEFQRRVDTATPSEILIPVLRDIFGAQDSSGTLLDYGAGRGQYAQLLRQMGYRVSAWEPDAELVQQYRARYYDGVEILSRAELDARKSARRKFDALLCSLVLCYPLGENETQQREAIHNIMDDITQLACETVVLVICNPLHIASGQSRIQTCALPSDFDYQRTTHYSKKILSSAREMQHTHRPLGFYEALFREYKLTIREVRQTQDPHRGSAHSDFMLFILSPDAAD